MRRFLHVFALLLPVAMAAPAMSRQDSLSSDVITTKKQLDEETRKKIEAYVEARVQMIATGSNSQAEKARDELVRPPMTLGASDIFRRVYAEAVRSRAQPIIDGKDEQRAVLCLTVLRFLFTAEALNQLAENAGRSRQTEDAIRLSAASILKQACKDMVEGRERDRGLTLNGAQADALGRKIREAAAEESSWQVLMELSSALSKLCSAKELPPASLQNLRSELLRVLQRTVEVSDTDKTGNTMRATVASLMEIRSIYPNLPATDKPAFRQQLEPILGTIEKQSKSVPANADDTVKRAYNNAGQSANLLLHTILPQR